MPADDVQMGDEDDDTPPSYGEVDPYNFEDAMLEEGLYKLSAAAAETLLACNRLVSTCEVISWFLSYLSLLSRCNLYRYYTEAALDPNPAVFVNQFDNYEQQVAALR
jgi:hypothetical protein